MSRNRNQHQSRLSRHENINAARKSNHALHSTATSSRSPGRELNIALRVRAGGALQMQQSPNHEAQCKRCGECCRVKTITRAGHRIILDFYCPGLDPETKLCRIYDKRHSILWRVIQTPCLSVDSAKAMNDLPETCGYVIPGTKMSAFDPNRLRLVPRWQYWTLKLLNWYQRQRLNRYLCDQAGVRDRPPSSLA